MRFRIAYVDKSNNPDFPGFRDHAGPILPGVLDGPGLAYHGVLYLAGVLKLFLYLICDVASHFPSFHIRYFLGLYDDTDFSTCCDGVAFLNTGLAVRKRFKLFKAFDVVLDGITSCA